MSLSIVLQCSLWLVTLLVLVSAIWVVALANLFRAALSLGLVLAGVAGLFVLLEAEFVAFVQILVYVGAILTLVVFAIMLTARPTLRIPQPPLRQRLPAAVFSIVLFLVLGSVTQVLVGSGTVAPEAVSLAQLGRELVTTLVLPFEVISVVFVGAIVGAIAIAHATPSERSRSHASHPTPQTVPTAQSTT